jgi:peptidoglycan/LPS O-acetylase OafA/YrhL
MQPELRPASPEPANKLPGLEVLRFLSAFAILVLHYQHFAFVADKPAGLVSGRLPFYGLFHVVFDAGAYGVWIFWCISGFIFFWKYRDAIADRSVGGWKFFVLRFSRLYPLHLATLLLVALLQPVYFGLNGYFFVYQDNDLWHFLLQLFMASNWGLLNGYSFNGPIWSISIEVLAYILFFLMLLATRSWLLNLVVIAGCLTTNGQVAACFAFFYIGGLAAIARRAIATMPFKRIVEGVAWLAAVMLPPSAWFFTQDQLVQSDFLLLLTYTPILLFCLSCDVTVPAPIQKAVEAAGNMTYSSYLLHFPIQLTMVIGFALAKAQIPVYDATFFGIYLAVTLLASYLAFRYFEAPAQNLLRERMLRPRAAGRQTALGLTK